VLRSARTISDYSEIWSGENCTVTPRVCCRDGKHESGGLIKFLANVAKIIGRSKNSKDSNPINLTGTPLEEVCDGRLGKLNGKSISRSFLPQVKREARRVGSMAPCRAGACMSAPRASAAGGWGHQRRRCSVVRASLRQMVDADRLASGQRASLPGGPGVSRARISLCQRQSLSNRARCGRPVMINRASTPTSGVGEGRKETGGASPALRPSWSILMNHDAERVERLNAMLQLRKLQRDLLSAETMLDLELKDDVAPETVSELAGKELSAANNSMDLSSDIQEMQNLYVSLKTNTATVEERVTLLLPEDRTTAKALVKAASAVAEGLQLAMDELGRMDSSNRNPSSPSSAKNSTNNNSSMMMGTIRAFDVQREVGVSTERGDYMREDGSVDWEKLRSASRRTLRWSNNLWMRLNGVEAYEAVSNSGETQEPSMGAWLGMRVPRSRDRVRKAVSQAMEEKQAELLLIVDSLQRELRDASRQREVVLRQYDPLQLAEKLRELDAKVEALRRELAVVALEMELDGIYGALQGEILGSINLEDDELLVAEFGLMDARLSRFKTLILREESVLIKDENIAQLAKEIPDFKDRLGLSDRSAFRGGMSLARLKVGLNDSLKKTRGGIKFFARGLQLLGGDLWYATKLFERATRGHVLTAREVRTLRRTFKDMFTVIPMTIILILPISPVGHVLVFGFIQKYFPNFFPSTFNENRQANLERYETIKTLVDREGFEAAALQALESPITRRRPGDAEDETEGVDDIMLNSLHLEEEDSLDALLGLVTATSAANIGKKQEARAADPASSD